MVTAPALALQDWEAVGHGLEAGWLELASRYGAVVIGAFALAVVVRSIARRRRYRAVDVLSSEAAERLRAAVAAEEARTCGEIAVVVVESSDAHPDTPWKAALVALVAGTVLLAGALPAGQPARLVLVQIAMALVGMSLARWVVDFRRAFVTERRATEVSEEQAVQEFHRLAIAGTNERNGVLIFVSLFEHRVVVLAGEGANAAVGESAWLEVDDEVLRGIRAGSLEAGLAAGIAAAGAVLADKMPATGERRNALPDPVIVRRC